MPDPNDDLAPPGRNVLLFHPGFIVNHRLDPPRNLTCFWVFSFVECDEVIPWDRFFFHSVMTSPLCFGFISLGSLP